MRDALDEVRKLTLEGAFDRPNAPASERARGLYLRGMLLDAVGDDGSETEDGRRRDDADAPGGIPDDASDPTPVSERRLLRNEPKPTAEELLKRAAKLDPSLENAWFALANLLWKKDDLEGARNCLAAPLRANQNPKALRLMSALSRRFAESRSSPGSETQKKYVAESMAYAKAAVKCDVRDGHSWYQVGMAYMTSFFARGATETTLLRNAVKAYDAAEKGGPTPVPELGGSCASPSSLPSKAKRMDEYPDVYFNRAVVLRYLEEYERCLRDFAAAARLDAGLPTRAEIEAVVAALADLDDGCRGVGPAFKPKRLASARAALGEDTRGSAGVRDLRARDFAELAVGANDDAYVRARVVLDRAYLGRDDSGTTDAIALHFIVIDSSGNLCAMSAYGLEDGAVRSGSTVTLARPDVRDVDVTWNGRRFAFRLIRVDDAPNRLLVNGKTPVGRIARPRLRSTNVL